LERPKLRGTTAAFASRLLGKYVTKTNALETLVIAAFVRGLSERDVEATLAEALGDQANEHSEIGNHAFKPGGAADVDSRAQVTRWFTTHLPPIGR